MAQLATYIYISILELHTFKKYQWRARFFNLHAIMTWINFSAAQILPHPLPTSMGLEITII